MHRIKISKPVLWTESNPDHCIVYTSLISVYSSKHYSILARVFWRASGPLLTHAFQVTWRKQFSHKRPYKSFDLEDTERKLSSQKSPQLGANQQSGIVKDFSKGKANCLPASCFRMAFTTSYSTYEHQVVHDTPRKQKGTYRKSS